MATLYINLSDSRCGACRRNADPYESAHTMAKMRGVGCDEVYTAVSSDYSGAELMYERIKQMRPDLPFMVGGPS